MERQLHPRGKKPRYPLNGKLGGHQILCETFGKEKNTLVLAEIEPRYWIQYTLFGCDITYRDEWFYASAET